MYVRNGHSFNGSWGYNGKKENRNVRCQQGSAAVAGHGRRKMERNGGRRSAAIVGKMACTQSGPSTVCKVGPVVINGKFRTSDKVRATWTNGDKTGWFSFWFNDDNNSFNGIWGYGSDDTTGRPRHRSAGALRLNSPQL